MRHLSLRCCNLRGVVDSILSCQPSSLGLESRMDSEFVMQYEGTRKEMLRAPFFLLQYLALQLGLGQGCQPEGITITLQLLFRLRKHRIVTLECGSLHKFCTTAPRLKFLWNGSMEWNMEENFSMEWKIFSMKCKWNGIVIVITFYSPSWLGQETAKGLFGLPVKLPPVYHTRWWLYTDPFNAER